MISYRYLPKGILQHLVVEVYLPKNLLNYGALIELLSQTLEFNCAKNWLLENCKRMWDEDGIWEAYFREFEGFEQQIRDMEKTIIGYSIYEVDGAFEYNKHDKGQEIPVKVFTLIEKSRQGFIETLENEDIDKIKLVLEENSQSLENTNNVKIYKNPDGKHWEIRGDEKTLLYEIADTGTHLNVSKYIRLLEERTLVIRFLTDLEIEPQDPHIFADKDSEDEKMERAYKRLWDTMIVIGSYLVSNLGSHVSKEDVIWITYDSGFLWQWKKGKPIHRQPTQLG